jgi:hypothetical protein
LLEGETDALGKLLLRNAELAAALTDAGANVPVDRVRRSRLELVHPHRRSPPGCETTATYRRRMTQAPGATGGGRSC